MFLDWLRIGLSKPGKTHQGLADALGVDRSAVTKMLSGRRKIQASELIAIAEYIGETVPTKTHTTQVYVNSVVVRAVAASGVWRERGFVMRSSVAVPIIPDPRLAGFEQYALKIEGTDFNKVFNEGDFPIFVRFQDVRRVPHDSDIVHIRRVQAGMVEDSVKRVRLVDRHIELWPESTDPSNQRPIIITDLNKLDGMSIEGLYVGLYRPAQI